MKGGENMDADMKASLELWEKMKKSFDKDLNKLVELDGQDFKDHLGQILHILRCFIFNPDPRTMLEEIIMGRRTTEAGTQGW
jgi:hypothetical protein